MSSIPFDPTADLYGTLGVKPEATAADIKKAYRHLAKQYHPDSTGGDKAKETKFKEISTAYDVLGDRAKRAQYDAFRVNPHYPPGAGFGGGAPGGMPDLGDLFSQVFSGGRSAGGPGGGVRYTFNGGGGGPFGHSDPSDIFGGNPRRRRVQRRRSTPRERKVRASDGSTMIQRGRDFISDAIVSIDQAILGTVVQVPTLSGTAKVKIPPGTSSGAKLRLRGKGASDGSGSVGDHYIVVQIEVPKNLDDKAKKLLAQFMRRIKK